MSGAKIRNVPRDLLCKVGNHIWGANCKCTIEHPKKEHEAIALIACGILPVMPHKSIRSVLLWHNCAHNDSDEHASNGQEASKRFDRRKYLVREQDERAGKPSVNQISHKYLPSLWLEARMEQSVHRDCLGCNNQDRGSEPKDPGQKVPPAGEPSAKAPVSSCRY